jgi:hypothetical protein
MCHGVRVNRWIFAWFYIVAFRIANHVFLRPAGIEFLYESHRLPKLVAGGYKNKLAIPRSRENVEHLPSPQPQNMPGLSLRL